MLTVDAMWERLKRINKIIKDSQEKPDKDGWPNTAHHVDNIPSFIDRFGDSFSSQELSLIAETIEDGLKNGDEYCQTVAATYFLEALVNITDRRSGPAGRLLKLLGPEAREYIDAYDQLHGVPPRKWDQ